MLHFRKTSLTKNNKIMKKITLFLIIATATIFSCCNKTKTTNFLFLNEQQLKPLGIELRDNGVFYKNINPNHVQDGEKYTLLAFHCTNDNYLTTKHYTEADIAEAEKNNDSTMAKIFYSKNDFYPLLIGNPKGQMSLDKYSVLNKEMKLLPVAICMSDAKFVNRTDTIVIWFKPTESLKKALPYNIKLDDYLKVPTITK